VAAEIGAGLGAFPADFRSRGSCGPSLR
jgi:hypothetical protein